MHKFYQISKGRFSVYLCNIYAIKVCIILEKMLFFLLFFFVIFYVTQTERIYFILLKTFSTKGQEK